MNVFKETRKELIESGFTDLEATGVAAIFSAVPESERLWGRADAKELIMRLIYEGIEPLSNNQQALIDGTLSLTEKQRRYYYAHVFEGISMSKISRREGLHFETVRHQLEIAKGKLASAKNGELDWKNNKLIDEFLETVPERSRSYFEIHCRQGLTAEETARKLGVSVHAVRRIVRKLKNEIHETLAKSN